ncbi:hypothetical protein EMIT0162MI3_50008 [Pseudomonas chlororaphis]
MAPVQGKVLEKAAVCPNEAGRKMIRCLQALPYRRLAQPCTGYPQLAPQYLCASPKVGHKHCVAFF